MKILTLLLSVCLATSGCAFRVYEGGNLILSDSSDSDGELKITTKGGTKIYFKGKRDNSTPTRVALHGAHKLWADTVTGAIGLSTPGSGVVPSLVKGGGLIAPQINAPQK